MGKVEKVIVLSVLFLVALILVVTVTVDDPLDKTNVVEAGAKKGAPAVAQAPAQTPAAPVLNSTIPAPAPVAPTAVPANVAPTPAVTTPAPTTPAGPGAQPLAQPAAPALPPGALLKRLDGLQDSWFPDLKLYTWKEGDSWRALANTYYGDWMRFDVLKRHNEGRMDVQPGESVFIPVFADERAMAAAQTPGASAGVPIEGGAVPEAKPASKSGAKGKNEPKAASKASGKKFHTVANGESLWKIAKAELGDGNRWKEIYEANRDLLDKPESIKKGMRLRIP